MYVYYIYQFESHLMCCIKQKFFKNTHTHTDIYIYRLVKEKTYFKNISAIYLLFLIYSYCVIFFLIYFLYILIYN